MEARFELEETSGGKFVFNLIAANQEIILTSQLYASKHGAEEGIASVARNAAFDERYEEKTGVDGKLYFLLHAANKLVIGRSQMYGSKEAMKKGIASVKRHAPKAETVDASIPVRA
jgi:uncharacterized protein YegP (UPF0339 family)